MDEATRRNVPDGGRLARGLPEPAPSFPALVGIHLRLSVREVQLGSAILAPLAVALPVAVLISPVPDLTLDPSSPPAQLLLLPLMGILMVITVAAAFLQPEAVWRKLGPGERGVLDALPVTRRRHRMARVLAGAAFPSFLLASLFLTTALMRVRGWDGVFSPFTGLEGWGMLAAGLSLLAAYTFSSILALRFGRVIVPLLLFVVAVVILPMILLTLGVNLMRWPIELLMNHPFSPIRVLLIIHRASTGDLLPTLSWLAIFGGVATYVAGRHDRA